MIDAILVLNTGSSSVKFALYGAEDLDVLVRGCIDNVGGREDLRAEGRRAAALLSDAQLSAGGHADQLAWLLDHCAERLTDVTFIAAGHRIVHGGEDFSAPVVLDQAAVTRLEQLIPLAPAHQPHNLAGISAVAARWPNVLQIGCFDTAFHRSQPRLARLFPLPRHLAATGVLRYGFHGLSYQHVADILPSVAGARAEGRVIVAHLGNGASLCAMKQRRSIATTMGMTSLDGLMMGTRSGAVDPGMVLYLLQERQMSADAVAKLLTRESGLLGISEISSDVRVLEASEDPRATEALDLFAYRAVREIGSLVAALEGLDLLVFTGGIGEHSAKARQRICDRLGWVGVRIDPEANHVNAAEISSPDSSVSVHIVTADEELSIAKSAQDFVFRC